MEHKIGDEFFLSLPHDSLFSLSPTLDLHFWRIRTTEEEGMFLVSISFFFFIFRALSLSHFLFHFVPFFIFVFPIFRFSYTFTIFCFPISLFSFSFFVSLFRFSIFVFCFFVFHFSFFIFRFIFCFSICFHFRSFDFRFCFDFLFLFLLRRSSTKDPTDFSCNGLNWFIRTRRQECNFHRSTSDFGTVIWQRVYRRNPVFQD